MEIKSQSSRKTMALLTCSSFAVLILLACLKIVSNVMVLLSGILLLLFASRRTTSSIAFNKSRINITWHRFYIEDAISRPIGNITLEVIYAGATGKSKDAILNIFEGATCIYQVPVKHGFTEDDFRRLVRAFNKLKVSSHN